MFRSPLGRKLALRTRAARRLLLVLSLFTVAASLPFINAGAWRQEEDQLRKSPVAAKGKASVIAGAEFVPGEVLVRFRSDAAAKSAEVAPMSLRREVGDGEVSFQRFAGSDMVRGLRLAKVEESRTLEAVAELAGRSDVLYAEPNYIWRAKQFVPPPPNDPRYTNGEQYGMARINAPGAWNAGVTGSKNIVVGVLDGGVDINHPDLKDNLWTNTGEVPDNNFDDDGNGYADDVHGWDFDHNDKSIFDNEDGDDHATHVAGTLGAKGNNGIGVTGVNWDVSIMALKVLGEDGGSTANIIKGYQYVLDMRQRGVNIRVLNNSYGGPGKSLAALDAITQLNAAGILFVAAAGNGGGDSIGDDNFTFPDFPASYDLPNVLAVASTNTFDGLSSFSNFGARIVSMAAPGSSILSTTPNNTYSVFGGTSMAAPHVAGAAALICSAKPSISMSELRGVLAFTGDRLPSTLDGRTTTGRRLNVGKALESALQNDLVAPAPVGNLRVTSSGGSGRLVSLAWTATGDDGNAGTVADYDFFFVHPTTGAKTLLPTTLDPAPAGTQQSVLVTTPYRNVTGTILLRAYDNAGNSSDTLVAMTIPDNHRSNPYTFSLSPGAGLTSIAGAPLITGDDKYASYTIPFAFPFYGENRSAVTVSTNGAIYFSTPPRRDNGDADDAGSFVQALQGQRMIAGLWDDIDINTTRRADSGVFVTQPDANHVIFRWQGVPCNSNASGTCTGGNPINFEIELRSDGTIQMRYGQNALMFPVVGISGGEPDAYVVPSHTSETSRINLTNAQTVTFTPRARSLTISGKVTDNNGAALSGVTLTLSGTHFATATTDALGNYFFANLSIGAAYTVVPSKTDYAFMPSSRSFANNGLEDITADFTGTFTVAGPNSVGLAQVSYQYGEGDGRATFTVTRSGDTSGTLTVDYRTTDSDTFSVGCADTVNNNGGAFARCDFATTSGRLSFAAGELSKTITVPLIDDGHDESAETFQLQLTNASGTGTSLGAQSVATVTLQDNDTGVVANPIVTLAPANYPFF
ncbi:MAG TPA: S8 family serine peptidase, partial [Pyrinomonadaceae bacterium]